MSTNSTPATLQNYPCGRKAQTTLKKILLETKNPTATIIENRQEHSLHKYIAKAFGTNPTQSQEDSAALTSSKKRTTRGEIQQKQQNELQGLITEEFQPESVLTFCNYLGVSRYEMHKTVSDSLRSALENEIDKVDLSRNKDSILELLKSSFQFINVPDLRQVFVTILKKLGDETPVEVLVLLASKSKKNANGLKYGDLLNSFEIKMKRLVLEADWDSSIRPDGMPLDGSSSSNGHAGTLNGDNIFVDIVRPSIEAYLNDEELGGAADLAYTGSIREKRLDTVKRRAINSDKSGGAAAVVATSLTGKLSALTKVDKEDGADAAVGQSSADGILDKSNVTGLALNALREAMGPRPNLLAAVLNILIAEHGKFAERNDADAPMRLVNGSSSLHCTLLSDVLLSYGQLPRQYEDVRLLAQTLDKCVRIGIVSDQAIGQIQHSLKSIFQPDQDTKEQPAVVKREKIPDPKPLHAKKRKDVQDTVVNNEAERHFELKLLRKIIESSVVAMKECDPQGLFLNSVTDDIAPGYSRLIKNPMCTRTIEEKAVNLRYETLGRYEIDVQLMFHNCIRYNIGQEGSWFRGEAKRQQKKWREEILSQTKELYQKGMSKRKKQLDNVAGASASGLAKSMEESKKREILDQQRLLLMGHTKGPGEKRKLDEVTKGDVSTVKQIEPLNESKKKKRKKDISFPSMPALASMLLTDPFVVRLLFDKILRSIKNDVMKNKSIPADHGTIPSVLQLIHIANLSSKVCSMKGKLFAVPEGGLVSKSSKMDDGESVQLSESFSILRQQIPRLASLLHVVELDKRIAGGDLHVLAPLPKTNPKDWEISSPASQTLLLDLVEGALVHLLQGGVSNEAALMTQFPRFLVAINTLSRGNMRDERCFFVALTQSILRYKTKLPHSIRDMIVNAWLQWFTTNEESTNTMTSAVHSCFISLLNEWSSLGNLVLPVDTMVSWSEEAVKACEACSKDKSLTFAHYWHKDEETFSKIKAQYEQMLKGMPEDRVLRWKEAVGISSS